MQTATFYGHTCQVRWPITVTAKRNRSRRKEIADGEKKNAHGEKKLFVHDKKKLLTGKRILGSEDEPPVTL